MYRTLTLALVSLLAPSLPANADDASRSDGSRSVLDSETYLLRYSLQPGERLRYQVTHVAKTKTRIRGAEEVSRVHTESQRHWQVQEVTPEGDFVFDHVLDTVAMTQQQGDAEEVRWDSTSGEEPPAPFKVVASQIGTPLATVTVNGQGQEKDRTHHGGTEANLGMGSLTLVFPAEAIPVGHAWSVPQETKVRTKSGEVKTIKIRQRYTLEKVKTGVATLSVRSEPLTPVREESVRAQLVQQLSNGTIRFDVDNGRMLSKQLDWDERVVGFQGPNSLMEYNARFTEELIEDDRQVALGPADGERR